MAHNALESGAVSHNEFSLGSEFKTHCACDGLLTQVLPRITGMTGLAHWFF